MPWNCILMHSSQSRSEATGRVKPGTATPTSQTARSPKNRETRRNRLPGFFMSGREEREAWRAQASTAREEREVSRAQIYAINRVCRQHYLKELRQWTETAPSAVRAEYTSVQVALKEVDQQIEALEAERARLRARYGVLGE